jgi:hypothetical protein
VDGDALGIVLGAAFVSFNYRPACRPSQGNRIILHVGGSFFYGLG